MSFYVIFAKKQISKTSFDWSWNLKCDRGGVYSPDWSLDVSSSKMASYFVFLDFLDWSSVFCKENDKRTSSYKSQGKKRKKIRKMTWKNDTKRTSGKIRKTWRRYCFFGFFFFFSWIQFRNWDPMWFRDWFFVVSCQTFLSCLGVSWLVINKRKTFTGLICILNINKRKTKDTQARKEQDEEMTRQGDTNHQRGERDRRERVEPWRRVRTDFDIFTFCNANPQ